MKAKFINEKFDNESDPIKDMGIGTITWETLSEDNLLRLKIRMEQGFTYFDANDVIKIVRIINLPNDKKKCIYHLARQTEPPFTFYNTIYECVFTEKEFEKFFEPINKWQIDGKE